MTDWWEKSTAKSLSVAFVTGFFVLGGGIVAIENVLQPDGNAAFAAQWHGGDHPLVGTIVDVDTGDRIDADALGARLIDADFILIGEKHDNERHHQLQAALVHVLGADGALDAVAFEMVQMDRQLELTEHLSREGGPDGLDATLGWDELGWPAWAWYAPIFEAAHDRGAELVAADLPKSGIGAVYRHGLDRAFKVEFLTRTGLDQPLSAAMAAELEQEMVDAHCGHELGDAAAAMVSVQRAKDAMMADRLARMTGDGRGVLIAGNGHVRADRGVPFYLQSVEPDAQIVSIGLIEVEPDWQDVPTANMPYDYVWVTPRAKPVDFDYCEGISMPKAKKSKIAHEA